MNSPPSGNNNCLNLILRSKISLHIGRIQKVGVTYLNRGVSLLVQGTLKISVLRHLETHDFVLPRPWPWSCFVVAKPRLFFGLWVFPDFRIWLGPLELIGMVFHFPLASDSGFHKAIELSLGVHRFGEVCVDIGLLYMLESWLRVAKQWPIFVVFSKVKVLSSGHPLGNVFTIVAALVNIYVELMRYFLRCTMTSELYLGAVLPRLDLKRLFCLGREPTVILELYIFIY